MRIAHIPSGINKGTIIREALKELKRFKCESILLVEVNAQCSLSELQEILTRMKEWGDDLHLCKPVVVLSSSRSALAMTIGLRELRVICEFIPNLTDEEVCSFVTQMLSEFNANESNINELVKDVLPVVGNTLGVLHSIMFSLKKDECRSAEAAARKIREHRKNLRNEYFCAFSDLMKLLKLEQVQSGREYSNDMCVLCERFRKDNVSLDELSEMTHIPTEVITAHLVKRILTLFMCTRLRNRCGSHHLS